MTTMYRVAILCGALPLVTGVSVFLLWVWFRWDWLMTAGGYVIFGGVVLFLIGTICLARFRLLALEDSRVSYRRRFWQSFAGAWLLFINFPAAAAIMAAAIQIDTLHTVSVQNQSDAPLEEFTVSGGGITVEFGTIEPGASKRRSFHVEREGVLMCSTVHQGERLEATVNGYVTPDMGGRRLVRVMPDGAINVTDPDAH